MMVALLMSSVVVMTSEMELESGTQFDPRVIGALWRVLHCEEAMATVLELPVSR